MFGALPVLQRISAEVHSPERRKEGEGPELFFLKSFIYYLFSWAEEEDVQRVFLKKRRQQMESNRKPCFPLFRCETGISSKHNQIPFSCFLPTVFFCFVFFCFQDVKGPHAKLRVPMPKITEPLPPGKTCPVKTSGAGKTVSCATYFVVILSLAFPKLYFE